MELLILLQNDGLEFVLEIEPIVNGSGMLIHCYLWAHLFEYIIANSM